jgi:hypothetical protein
MPSGTKMGNVITSLTENLQLKTDDFMQTASPAIVNRARRSYESGHQLPDAFSLVWMYDIPKLQVPFRKRD